MDIEPSREFRAIVWLGPSAGKRVKVVASSLEHATAQLEKTYGTEATISVWNEDDASALRQARGAENNDESGSHESIATFGWMGALSSLHAVPQLALLSLVLFSSPYILESGPLESLAQGMLRQWPWLGNHASATTYPTLALAMACVAVVGLCWSAGVWFVQSMVNYKILLRRQQQHRTMTWRSAALAVPAVPAMLLCFVFVFAIPGDPSWAKGITTDSPMVLGLLLSPFIYAGGAMVGGLPLVFRLLLDRKINSCDLESNT